jgi:hypothetical protein
LAGGGGSFKTEALGALLTGMTSEEFVGKVVIVFAGYERPLAQLLRMDPGLTRRFTARIVFEAVEPLHAEAVLLKQLRKQGLKVAGEALSLPAGAAARAQEGPVASFFRSLRDKNPEAFGNLGDVESFSRKLFEAAAARIMAPIEERRAASAAASAGSAPQAPELPQWDKVYTLADVRAAAEAALLERPAAPLQEGLLSEPSKGAREEFLYEGGGASSGAPPKLNARAAERKRDAGAAAPPGHKPAGNDDDDEQKEEEGKVEEKKKAGGGGGKGEEGKAAPGAPPKDVAFALQGAFQQLGLDNAATFKRIMIEGPQGKDWKRLAEATRKNPAVAALQGAERAVQEALEWCASNLAASEKEARELDEAASRRRGLEAELAALMGSAAAATEEERREKERKRIALEEALRKAREEQERLEELKRQRSEYCNYCGRANTPYSGCAYRGRSDNTSWR